MDNLPELFSSLNLYDNNNQVNQVVEAKCMQMCPPKEMSFRERNGLLHRMELINPNEWSLYQLRFRGKDGHNNSFAHRKFTDAQKSVKQYQRSSAGKETVIPENIRPTSVLKKTIDYLIDDCFDTQFINYRDNGFSLMESFGVYYDFVFDRLRSVRQDMTIQRALDSNCLYILERCIEFYIYSHFVWIHIGQSSSITMNNRYFDAHLHETHFKDSLYSLISYYDYFSNILWSRWRCRFEMLYMLYNLRPEFENQTFKRYRKLKLDRNVSQILKLKQFQIINNFIRNYLIGNHIQILRQINMMQRKYKLLCCSFFTMNLPYHHMELLKSISLAYRSPATRLPLSVLTEWFCPKTIQDSNENVDYVENLFRQYEIPIELNRVDYFDYDEKNVSHNAEQFVIINKKFANISQWTQSTQRPLKWIIFDSLPDCYKKILQQNF
ncbi:uncharacterized protein LOC124499091 [Dermatophagoides farinae]|uniref:SAC3/GANP/THP3 conserved domain-containing protein n=1 Tax=Dermatophagoides farinae TaxID=6954 RepID=A0A9D4SL24_DERFA|nr:SAC3 family protein C-like [Dermatophagoides farinae]KAH7645863.1 hypothetical protein HUG17_1401 [Dermatophagoides farinae]